MADRITMSEHELTEMIKDISAIQNDVKWIVKKLDGNGEKGLCERITSLERWQARIMGGSFILGVLASILFNVAMRLI
jgi:hypothetical protein